MLLLLLGLSHPVEVRWLSRVLTRPLLVQEATAHTAACALEEGVLGDGPVEKLTLNRAYLEAKHIARLDSGLDPQAATQPLPRLGKCEHKRDTHGSKLHSPAATVIVLLVTVA